MPAPPGFGPKLPKDAAPAVSAKAPLPYAIRLESEEEERLRALLRAADATINGGCTRLLRDVKRLHVLYSQLARLGFEREEVELCLSETLADANLNDCLDWCCLYLPDAKLPASYRLVGPTPEEPNNGAAVGVAVSASDAAQAKARARVAEAMAARKAAAAAARRGASTERRTPDAALATAAATAINSTAAAPASIVAVASHEGHEGSKAEATVKEEHADAGEWTRAYARALQDACGSSDEEDELTDALGVLELKELGEEVLQQLHSQKRGALEAQLAAPALAAHRLRRLQRHVAELEMALQALAPKPQAKCGGAHAVTAAKKRAERVAERSKAGGVAAAGGSDGAMDEAAEAAAWSEMGTEGGMFGVDEAGDAARAAEAERVRAAGLARAAAREEVARRRVEEAERMEAERMETEREEARVEAGREAARVAAEAAEAARVAAETGGERGGEDGGGGGERGGEVGG